MGRLLGAMVAVSCGVASAADGDPDPTFNGNGTQVLTYSGSPAEDDRTTGLCVQPDGRLLVHGVHAISNAGHQVKLVRLLADGGLDPAFTTVTVPGTFQGAVSCALQSDGRILLLVAGTTHAANEFALYRYTSAGVGDETFGPGGLRLVPFELFGGAIVSPAEVVVQADDRIILVGTHQATVNSSTIIAMRLMPTGALDLGYGTGGQVAITRFAEVQGGLPRDAARRARLSPDGSLTIVGDTARMPIFAAGPVGPIVVRYDARVAVARLGSTGAIATGFGNGGVIDFDAGTNSGANGLALLADGRLLVLGGGYLLRFTPLGGTDFSFRGSGAATFPPAATQVPSVADFVVQDDGRILLAGFVLLGIPAAYHTYVARLLADGSPDPTFGSGAQGTGVVVRRTAIGGYGHEFGAALGLQFGKPVLAGWLGYAFLNFQQDYSYQYVYRLTNTLPLLVDGFESP